MTMLWRRLELVIFICEVALIDDVTHGIVPALMSSGRHLG